MKNNLSLAGSEIINESKSRYNNSIISITSPIKNNHEQKIITKSYKIIDQNISNINNISNNNIETPKDKKPSQNKKVFSLDLSKIKYNDGYILTDAANSNPGFGLWALKTGTKDKNRDTFITQRKSVSNVNNISTIRNNIVPNNTNVNKITFNSNDISNNKINDKSLSLSNNSKNDENKKRNNLIIENLKMICNDLESKCINLMSDLEHKIYMCNNSIKSKVEYENILRENTKDIELIKEKCKNLSLENNKLTNVYKKVETELNRVLNIMKTDKENMEKIKEEFNIRLKQEDNERERLNTILKAAKEKVQILEHENEKSLKENKNNFNKNNNIEIMVNKDSEARKEFEEENLDNLILELELKICGMKKKINSQEEENEKLRKILKYKEERNDMEKYKLMNLNNILKIQKENQKNDLNYVSKQNSVITELKNKIGIKTNFKLNKSYSLKKSMK